MSSFARRTVAMPTDTGRVIASCFALAAFAVAIFAGLAGENAAAQILLRAVTAMIVCYPVGLIVGLTCDHLIRAHARAASAESGRQAGESANANMDEADDSPIATVGGEIDTTRTRAAA